MRELAASTATEAAKQTGSYPIRVLQIDLPSENTVLMADRAFSPESGVDVLGVVKTWGELTLEPEMGQVGGYGSFTCTVSDLDWRLSEAEAVQPGIQTVRCTLYLWFVGTPWADRLTLFAGTMGPQDFKIGSEEVSLTIKGLEEFWNKDIGYRITQEEFPTIKCSECDGKILPIVFGDPVYRVPLCPIERPAATNLAVPLGICDTMLQIAEEASTLGFPIGEENIIDLVVGADGDYDKITGWFDEDDETIFHITDRFCFHGHGFTTGIYSTAGTLWVTIAKADLDDNGVKDMSGYPLIWPNIIPAGSDQCLRSTVFWWDTVPDPGELAIWPDNDSSFPTSPPGEEWIVLNRLNVPFYDAGTPVVEVGTWVYAANFLPIEGVDRVEVKGTIDGPQVGEKTPVFFTVNPYLYTVNTNDTAYNESILGRAADDPGIATITMTTSPIEQGFKDDIIYATIRGTMPGEQNPLTLDEDDAINEPAAAIAEIISNEFLGNVTDFQMDALQDAFDNIPVSIAFAILEQRGLWEVVGEIARQAGLLVYVDCGKMVVRRVEQNVSTPEWTSDNDNRHKASLSWKPRDVKEMPLEMIGKFRPTLGDDEQKIIRKSTDAILAIARAKSKEVDFWAIQSTIGVAYMTEWLLTHELSRNRRFTFEQFMPFLAAQPGDMVALTHFVIDDDQLEDERIDVVGRIVSVTHVPGSAKNRTMELIRITIECHEWTFEIYQGQEPYECGVERTTVDSPPPTVYTQETLGMLPGQSPTFYPQVITAENAESILCGDNCDDDTSGGSDDPSGGSGSGDDCTAPLCSVSCVGGNVVGQRMEPNEFLASLTTAVENGDAPFVDALKAALGIT